MATPSREYIVRGLKISLDILQDISSDLPIPASSIVNLVERIIDIIEETQKNREECEILRDRLLELLPVVIMTLSKDCEAGEDSEIPISLKRNVDRLQRNLEKILKDVEKIQKITNSRRTRHRIAAFVNAQGHTEKLQKCKVDLDWAMDIFEVTTRLEDSVRLCEVSRQVQIVLLETLPRAKYASSRCERPDRPATCFKGTRTALIELINEWVLDPDPKSLRCFWLGGIAGIGKTTVAHTIAEQAREKGLLGADFFFSRLGEAELRNPALVFPTIAYQLAHLDSQCARVIAAAIQRDPKAAFGSLKEQLYTLILEPLSKLKRDSKRVVLLVLDALDECEARGAKEILQLLVAALPSLPFFVKILITSRPEEHIRSVLLPSSHISITALHDIEKSIVEGDIELYLTARLRGLPKELGRDGLSAEWITADEIKRIADAAGTFFIHAATSLRFLMEGLNLRKRLDALLVIIDSSHENKPAAYLKAFYYLDQLYMQILLGVISPTNEDEVAALFQTVVGNIILLRDPLPLPALERLAELDEGDATDLLTHLHSVIGPPGPPDYCPRLYHPSFPDFLQHQGRCTDKRLWIDRDSHELRLVLKCLDLMNSSLHKNMLGDFDNPLPNKEIQDIEIRLKGLIVPELRYACLYWASHLVAIGPNTETERVRQALSDFATHTLLPWLETMSWIGHTSDAIECLEAVTTWLANSSSSRSHSLETLNLFKDAHRLLLTNFHTITDGAVHIARSALPFAAQNTQLLATYVDYADPCVRVIHGADVNWLDSLTTLTGHSYEITSVAFSSDGTSVVSASKDQTVRVWDTLSGNLAMTLKGHTAFVRSASFSPDGTQIVSGSDDRTVRIWDATTGDVLSVLNGHCHYVSSVAFHPAGILVASGSEDCTIRIWNTTTLKCVTTLEGHRDGVYSIAFSSDGKRLVSGTWSDVVRLWDMASKACISETEGRFGWVCGAALSPDGSRLTAGSPNGPIQIRDAHTGDVLRTLRKHVDAIYSIAFSPDGGSIISGSGDHTVSLWDTATGENLATFKEHVTAVTAVAFSRDGTTAISGDCSGIIKIWNLNAEHETSPLNSTPDSIQERRLAISGDGARVLVVNNSRRPNPTKPLDKYIILDASNGNQLSSSQQPPSIALYPPRSTPFRLDNRNLIWTDGTTSTVVCILPSALFRATDVASIELEDGGYHVAIGGPGPQVVMLHVFL